MLSASKFAGALRVNSLPYLSWTLNTSFYVFMCLKNAGQVSTIVDPDQIPQNATPDLGPQCLLRPVCLNI